MRGARCEIADRIAREARHVAELGRLRQNLQQEGILGVAHAHARDETARNAHRESGVAGDKIAAMRKADEIEQLARIADRIAPELLPSRGLRRQTFSGYHDGSRVRP